ncbi:tetraspanin-31-like [Clavelina lepadiformis]|uniref:tetraspanin-31-like n=1 Tax=Clavelina lepadiformis TaxID=159417 RepID=UPI00404340A4
MVSVVRYLFMVINILYVFFGAVLAAFASWLRSASPIREVLNANSTSLIVIGFILGAGILLMIIGVCGALGNVHRSKPIMGTYVAIAGSLLIIEITLVAYTVANKQAITDQAATTWTSISDSLKFLIQDRFSCCGYTSYTEWSGVYDNSCLSDVATSTPWATGCYNAVITWLDQDAVMLGGIVGGIMALTVCQLILSSKLLYDIVKSEKSGVPLANTEYDRTTTPPKKDKAQLIGPSADTSQASSNF